LAGNGPIKVTPQGFSVQQLQGPNPLDPKGLSTTPISATEQQQIADTLNMILNGNLAGLQPHPYENRPSEATGAELPPSTQGYTALDVPDPASSFRGANRLILQNGTLNFYYTNTHYKSFYSINLSPPKGQ
jgi:guanyl-specific ribonuclease Sa